MFKAARILQIKEIITNKTQVDIQTLSDLLGVSKVTIRSDLEELEKEGFIYRTHGGAVLKKQAHSRPSFEITPGTVVTFNFSEPILHIAKIAANYVEDNDWIFIGGGNTCGAIAYALKNRAVNVVTNNILAALALSENPQVKVILIGGKVIQDKFPYVSGDIASNNISSLFFKKTFYGVVGIDFKSGYSVPMADEFNIFQCLREHSEEVIIAADSSKCDKVSFLSLGPLDSVDTLISSKNFPETYRKFFHEKNIKLLTDL